VEPAWFLKQPLPAMQAWLVRWVTSPQFKACMVKLPSETVTAFAPLVVAMDAAVS